MARTTSRRRSRSDARGAPAAADAERAEPTSKKTSSRRSPLDERAAQPDGPPAPKDATPPSKDAPLGASSPGAIRIVACHGADTTEATDLADLPELLADPEKRIWIDMADPDDAKVDAVARILGLHPLIADDIRERNQRSKVESFDQGVIHIVLFALHYEGEARASEIDFVLGEHYLLTVHDGTLGASSTAPLKFGVQHALAKGADYLLYAIADSIVDGYFPVLDRIGDDIDSLQDKVMEKASDTTLKRLFGIKRELVELRRATSPAREIFAQLTNREMTAIDPNHIVYYRDVYDHLIRVTDELDNYRDLVSGTLDIYVSIVNNDLSRIMKRLTGVTVILAGIGAVAGIFGMSEAGAAFQGAEAGGFWTVTLGVILLAVAAAAFLRRIDWI